MPTSVVCVSALGTPSTFLTVETVSIASMRIAPPSSTTSAVCTSETACEPPGMAVTAEDVVTAPVVIRFDTRALARSLGPTSPTPAEDLRDGAEVRGHRVVGRPDERPAGVAEEGDVLGWHAAPVPPTDRRADGGDDGE